jgi:hypothetical protein
MTQDEKRAVRRYREKPGRNIMYIEGSGPIRDMSMIGMYIVDKEPLRVGTKITFVLCLGVLNVELQGTVTRAEIGRGMVIRFTDLTREAIRRLKIHISDLGLPLSETKK